ncbi:MAG: transposase [bacterium]|nr:transposase [bacterium]
MKLTAVVKLLPTDDQRQRLAQTLETANAACNWISAQAWQTKTFNNVRLHHLTYYGVREQFGLAAQLAVRCIGKVSDAYKLDKKRQRTFKPHGAVAFDSRILTWHIEQAHVSIWALGGRLAMPFVAGESHLELLKFQQGECDLVYRHGDFYLYATCDIPDDTPIDPAGFLGADMGVKNILVDSDGVMHSAKHLLNVRHRHRRLRKKLQAKGTKSAKRRLKYQSGKEARFARDVNHCISKQLVKTAKDTKRGIALEDLTHIRTRVRFPRRKRDELHTWSFGQLRTFIGYKAHRRRVPVVVVDARYISQQCSCCGHTSRSNRPNQATFKCVACGVACNADHNAAINIGRRAAVNPPYAVCVLGLNPATTASPSL